MRTEEILTHATVSAAPPAHPPAICARRTACLAHPSATCVLQAQPSILESHQPARYCGGEQGIEGVGACGCWTVEMAVVLAVVVFGFGPAAKRLWGWVVQGDDNRNSNRVYATHVLEGAHVHVHTRAGLKR